MTEEQAESLAKRIKENHVWPREYYAVWIVRPPASHNDPSNLFGVVIVTHAGDIWTFFHKDDTGALIASTAFSNRLDTPYEEDQP